MTEIHVVPENESTIEVSPSMIPVLTVTIPTLGITFIVEGAPYFITRVETVGIVCSRLCVEEHRDGYIRVYAEVVKSEIREIPKDVLISYGKIVIAHQGDYTIVAKSELVL